MDTTPDGTRLAAKIWLPKDAASDPVLAIIDYIPYRKRDGTVLVLRRAIARVRSCRSMMAIPRGS